MTTKKAVFFLVVAVLVGFWAWYFFIKMDKDKAIKVILKYDNDANLDTLKNFGEDYLISRAKAYQKTESTFELEGKKYSTSTGKAI